MESGPTKCSTRNSNRDANPLAAKYSSKMGAPSARSKPMPERVRINRPNIAALEEICQSHLNHQIGLGGTHVGGGFSVKGRVPEMPGQ
jgi:hypothetical protein